MRKILFLPWFLSALFVSCNNEDAPDCFKSAGDIVKESRELSSFDQLMIEDNFQIEIIQDSIYKVEIEAPKNIIPKLETSVESGVLYISNKNTCNFVRSFKPKLQLKIHAPWIREIQNRGTGDIRSPQTLFFPYLKIENRHAAGVVDLDIIGDSVFSYTQTGVADVILKGAVIKAELFNQGLGSIEAAALQTQELYINNSSINDITGYCSGYLFAINYFSGNITVFGQPVQKDIFQNGNGNINID